MTPIVGSSKMGRPLNREESALNVIKKLHRGHELENKFLQILLTQGEEDDMPVTSAISRFGPNKELGRNSGYIVLKLLSWYFLSTYNQVGGADSTTTSHSAHRQRHYAQLHFDGGGFSGEYTD